MWFRSKVARVVIGVALLLGLAGCSSLGFSANEAFRADGLPKREYLVGGGMHVQYMAPSDGRVYWVEETTQKILAMRSVKADQDTEFGADDMDADTIKKRLGVDLKDASFSLYFVPDKR